MFSGSVNEQGPLEIRAEKVGEDTTLERIGRLINEAQAGHIKPRDVLFSLSLLGLSHSLIEDTLLMMLIGADLSGILLGRVVFTLVVIFIMVRLVERCSASTVDRFLVKSVS